MIESNPDYISADDFDQDAFDSSLGNRLKQGWICIQATMMTIYMIIGIRNYNKLIQGWSKVKTLFIFQTLCIVYLLVNEFTHRHISGIFIILLFTQYSLFLTFCLVIDSCITTEQDVQAQRNGDKLRLFNKVFRICCHIITWGLLISTYWMKSCHESIYPTQFVCVVLLITLHNAYDMYLKYHDYMIDWENLPFISKNKLRYNQEMTQKQLKFLFLGNLIFGIISILTVASGYFIMNRQHKPGMVQHLLCVNGNEWIYLSPVGNIFGTLHQLLILMQINITQYVLVRIPRGMGIFKEAGMQHLVAAGLRTKLLDTGINEGAEDGAIGEGDYKNSDGTISLGKLLQKIKESQKQNDDNFRA